MFTKKLHGRSCWRLFGSYWQPQAFTRSEVWWLNPVQSYPEPVGWRGFSFLGNNGSKSPGSTHCTCSCPTALSVPWDRSLSPAQSIPGALLPSLVLQSSVPAPHCFCCSRSTVTAAQRLFWVQGWIHCSHRAAGIFLLSLWLTFCCWLPPVGL